MHLLEPNFVTMGDNLILFDIIRVNSNKPNETLNWDQFYQRVNGIPISDPPEGWLTLNTHGNTISTFKPITPFITHLDPCVIFNHVTWIPYVLPPTGPTAEIIMIMKATKPTGWLPATPARELEVGQVLDMDTIRRNTNNTFITRQEPITETIPPLPYMKNNALETRTHIDTDSMTNIENSSSKKKHNDNNTANERRRKITNLPNTKNPRKQESPYSILREINLQLRLDRIMTQATERAILRAASQIHSDSNTQHNIMVNLVNIRLQVSKVINNAESANTDHTTTIKRTHQAMETGMEPTTEPDKEQTRHKRTKLEASETTQINNKTPNKLKKT